MSDKSFGDYANKNIVKNPLLSTAVTGLSIEDLTHNAVLVPVASTQGLITGSENPRPQLHTLANTDHEITNLPSGDSKCNIFPSNPPLSTPSFTLDNQPRPPYDRKPELPPTTVSKASAKSDDDFDVNEYFARLQGTRYVSAPLHSHTDPNANIAASEENLEEINLNDDKSTEVQQSLTADIAQNFSQLPNVLPHVASAVFSSFSNIWNMKSREQTPDVSHDQYQMTHGASQTQTNQGSYYQDVRFGQAPQNYNDVHFSQGSNQGSNVPLMRTEEVKEVAPPPKEPPISGTSNYRLQTKKKYAQIPGLSTGESQAIAFNPLTQNVPSYFIPNEDINKNVEETTQEENTYNISNTSEYQPSPFTETKETTTISRENQPPHMPNQSVIPPPPMFSTRTESTGKGVLPPSVARRIGSNHPVMKQQILQQTSTANIFVPTFDSPTQTQAPNVPFTTQMLGQSDGQVNLPTATQTSNQKEPNSVMAQDTGPSIFNVASSTPGFTVSLDSTVPPSAVIPPSGPLPPPNMFSQTSAKTVPPSQTIGSSKYPPAIPQDTAPPGPGFPPQVSSSSHPNIFTAGPVSQQTSSTQPSIFPPTLPTETARSGPGLPPQTAPLTQPNLFSPPKAVAPEPIAPPKPPAATQPNIFTPLEPVAPGPVTHIPSLSQPNIFTPPEPVVPGPILPPQTGAPTQPNIFSPPGPVNPGITAPAPILPPQTSASTQPNLFNPQEPLAPGTNTTPSFFNPGPIEPPAPPKPLAEPPKATGMSYRMTKKRPQYYSGPIEGFGSISNNIKPVIPTAEPGHFQGAMFTPEVSQTENQTPSFDISKTEDVVPAPAQFDLTNSGSLQSAYPSYDTQSYNTAFDLSRPTTESYEQEPKETKGFGIIGSLKSKLSGLDINKIQNTVTTFFDPAYNEAKKDVGSSQENVPYVPAAQSSVSYNPPYQGQSNFEIFVPNAEQNPSSYYQSNPNAYGQTTEYSNQSVYGQMDYSNQYYQQQKAQYADPNTTYQSYPQFAEPTQNISNPQPQLPADSNIFAPVKQEENLPKTTEQNASKIETQPGLETSTFTKETSNQFVAKTETNPGFKASELDANPKEEIAQKTEATFMPPNEIGSVKNFFDMPQPDDVQKENSSFLFGDSDLSMPKNLFQMTTKSLNDDIELIKNPIEFDLHMRTSDISSNIRASIETQPKAIEIKSNIEKLDNATLGIHTQLPIVPDKVIQPPLPKALYDSNMATANTIRPPNLPKALKDGNIANYGSENIALFSNPALEVAQKVLEPSDVIPVASNSKTSYGNTTQKAERDRNEIVAPPIILSKALNDGKEKNEAPRSLLESLKKDDVPILAVSSVPLFGLSTIIAEKSKESNEDKVPLFERTSILDKHTSMSFFDISKNVEETSNVSASFFETDKNLDALIPSASFFTSDVKENIDAVFEKTISPIERPTKEIKNEIAKVQEADDLNICETCREVNKPDDRDLEIDDLTTQLIENITAPIQLSNSVEVPFTEANNTNRVEFDAGQYEEISHITEETIETIQVQSATELLDDDAVKMSYGWSTDDNAPSTVTHDFTYKVDANSIGFFGESLFAGNTAEIKQEDILPRQMSIPSAPPEEEDSKSDEAGILDVQSIELDAKEDFPIYEEFVIEPDAEDKEDFEAKSDIDSFTNRVEKFKKMEGEDEKPLFEMPSQPLMASYFDTGNYAVETHYRNSIGSPGHITIPPGFEEEFKKKFAITQALEGIRNVPDCATQTRPTITSSYSTAHSNITTTTQSVMPVGFNVEANVTKIVEDKTEKFSVSPISDLNRVETTENLSTDVPQAVEENKPYTLSYFASEADIASENKTSDFSDAKLSYSTSNFASEGVKLPDNNSIRFTDAKMPDTSFIFGSQANKPRDNKTIELEDTKTQDTGIFAAEIPQKSSDITAFERAKLPETTEAPKPANFGFGEGSNPVHSAPVAPRSSKSQEASSEAPNMPEASYLFGAGEPKVPAPTSFFNPTDIPDQKPAPTKLPDPINFFADSAPPPDNSNRLASYFTSPPKTEHAKSFFELSQSQNHYRHESYRDLMNDLTSVQNLAMPTDQTIRHVNYFTVEYENGSTDLLKDKGLLSEGGKDINSLTNCKLCTELIIGDYKVRQAINGHTENENTAPNMDTTSAKNRNSVTVDFEGIPMNDENTNEEFASVNENRSSPEYSPVKHHWFYRVDVEEKSIWRGFSVIDSRALEAAFLSSTLNENTLVATDGGRFDVNIMGRIRIPVYWTEKPTNVRRCSWFYKGTTDPRYVPYTESVADKLEEEYRHGMTTGEWHRRLVLPNGEVVVMHGPSVMVHFLNGDTLSTPPSSTSRPRVVRRGHDDSEIEDAEPSSIDHLLLLCHGVGSACDMRFRSVEEVVEDFRSSSLQLIQSHYRNSYDQGVVSRVEVLPISWHSSLHSGETGVDRRLAQITLDSIPRLRSFTNDTVLDVLFYTSPIFCQTIINTVCKELNRIYGLFMERNPEFKGGVSLGGHSLGSVILYDLLCHQRPPNETPASTNKSYVSGGAGTGQHTVQYPTLQFTPHALYALGSPIAIFECIRGVESLGADFSLPTCKNFFNIFHPYDPIAYRIEPLINPELGKMKPYLIPHHKGRKRMHLELKDTMARVGADLKQKLLESLRSTWNKWKAPTADGALERVVEEEVDKEQCEERGELLEEEKRELQPSPDMLGKLNQGRRVDYVLQEAPLEMINEYLFAMSSHVGYWESEDTMLLMLREIYSDLGIEPDSTVPQQSMTVQRTKSIDGVATDSPSTSGGTC